MADTETPKVADLSLASSAKMETPIVPLPDTEEPSATPRSSTKPNARPAPARIRPQDTGLKIVFHPKDEDVEYE